MPKLACSCVSLLLLAYSAASQVQSAELRELNAHQLSELRQHLGIPATVSVSIGSLHTLANANSMRVFLAVGPDPGIRSDFVKRIDKWNKKKGKRPQPIEIVDRAEDAELMLVQISKRLEPAALPGPTIEERAGVPGVAGQPIQLPPDQQQPDRDIHRIGYVIARGQGKLEVLARVTFLDRSGPHPQADASRILCEYFFSLVQKYSR